LEASPERARTAIAARLRARRGEIERAALARVYGISEPASDSDPEYLSGLRGAVAEAVEYGLVAIEGGEEGEPPVPTALLSQARLAARNGVTLDTVLRRYLTGFTLFSDFVMAEADAEQLSGDVSLHRVLQVQGSRFDRVVAAVTEEYNREAHERVHSATIKAVNLELTRQSGSSPLCAQPAKVNATWVVDSPDPLYIEQP